MKDDFSDRIESYINEMPSLPVSVGKVLEICNNENVNPSDLNKVIQLDPVLTGRLLKLINSAYYGINTHVTSLVKAIIMLGINTVKNLALSTAILGTLPKNKDIKGIDMEGYWRHCLCVGVTSKILAVKQNIDPKYHQEYFTAGLLHDIGKIALNAVLGMDYVQVVMTADKERRPLLEAENDNLGINHCTAGLMIADAWKLESPIADIIGWHHDIQGYSGDNLNLLCCVAAANYFSVSYDVGFSGDRKPIRQGQVIWDTTKLSDDVFDEIKDDVYKEIERAKVFLKV